MPSVSRAKPVDVARPDLRARAPFTVGLIAAHGTVKLTYNGETELVFEVSASGMYFKAGAYTQSNPSKGDEPPAIGQVVIYALHVTHSG